MTEARPIVQGEGGTPGPRNRASRRIRQLIKERDYWRQQYEELESFVDSVLADKEQKPDA